MHKYETGAKTGQDDTLGNRFPSSSVRIFSKPLAGQPTNCSLRWWRVLGRRRRANTACLSEDQLLDQATFLRGAIQRETCSLLLHSTLMRKGRRLAFSAGLLGWERDWGVCRTTTPTGCSRVGAWGNRLQISPFSPIKAQGGDPLSFLRE